MEFRFNCHPLFRQRIVRINNSLLPTGFVAQHRREALDATAQISEIINFVGQLSAQAQGLSNPVTTSQKLRNSDHHIYLMFEPNQKHGLVVGILKVGRKSLYVFDPNGETVNVTAPCVLDFYVHESRQRGGLGRELYEHMLKEEHIHPEEMAIDRPSEKLLGFLQKHYGLYKKIPQMNNFVVYEGFFANMEHASDIDGRRMHITASPNTNLFGPTFTTVGDQRRSNSQTRQPVVSPPVVQQPPVGRYAAKRPSCSMAQIIHNSPTTVSTEPDSTSSSTNNSHAPPATSAFTANNNEYENHHHDHDHHNHPDSNEFDQQQQQHDSDPEAQPSNDDGVAEEVLSANMKNLSMSQPADYIEYHDNNHHPQHHKPGHEVKFADEYADIPDSADPDPYNFHPHHLELMPQQQIPHQDQQMMMTNRENSASPQSISQQQTPEHPGLKKPMRYTKQHTGLKNMSSRIVLKATSLETKQMWVKRLREVIQETCFSGTAFALLKSPAKVGSKSLGQRLSKDIDDTLNDNDQDGSSLASFGSGNTTDSEKGGLAEVTWVIADHTASQGTSELTVTKGAQVEILDMNCSGAPEFCLVRLPINSTDSQEGLVPVSVLKPLPSSHSKLNNKQRDADALGEVPQENDCILPNQHTSPVNKRKGFSGKKWLPTQFRKLSHGKSDKLPPVEKTLISKKGSDKKAKDKPLEEVEPSTTAAQIELEAEEEPTIELPPPMKPIQDATTALSGTPSSTLSSTEDQTCTSAKITKALSLKSLEEPPAAVNQTADVAEIERIVKEKMQSFKYLENDTAITSNSIAEGGSSSSMGVVGSGLDDSAIGVPSVSNGGGSSSAASSVGGCGSALIKPLISPQYFESENIDENLTDEQGIEDILRKRMFALKELVTTEDAYVNDLSQIVNGYIAEIRNPSSTVPIPDDLKGGKERMVFGNMEAIYEWHRDHFLKALQRCQQNPHELGPLIKRSERKLHMYVVYCQNKPVSEHIVQEHMSYFDELRLKLKYKLCLGDMLIKPVQRIMKYELLLKDILKHTQRAGLTEEIPGLKDAMHIMRVVPKAANDMMDVGRLQKFEGKITAQGKLLLHGPLYCVEGASSSDKNSYNTQKPKELHVFLFEQNIIFAEIVGKKTQFTSPSYIYKAHIQVNKMTLQDLSDQTNGNRFSLCSIDPQRSSLSFICTAPTIELHNEWLNTIRNILQTQNDFLKAIQSPIAYQKELTKDS